MEENSRGPLLRLEGSLHWLPSSALPPAIGITAGVGGSSILLFPDHLLATSPFLRQLLPSGPLCTAYSVLLPDVNVEDVASALQLLATGKTDPIRGLTKFNKKMAAIWEVFELLGVQIDMRRGFQVTESVGTKLIESHNAPENSRDENGEDHVVAKLRVDDELWEGDSQPKSRISECEAEELQVEKCDTSHQVEEYINKGLEKSLVMKLSENQENNETIGAGQRLDHQNNCKEQRLCKSKESPPIFEEKVAQQESEEGTKGNTIHPQIQRDNTWLEDAVIDTSQHPDDSIKDNKREQCDEKPFLCPQCGVSFRLKSYLNRHIREVHLEVNKGDYICHHCGNNFKNKTSLKVHIRRCHSPQGMPCKHPDCEERFSNNKEASLHYKQVHILKKESKTKTRSSKTCQHCGESFCKQSSLDAHLKECQLSSSGVAAINFSSEDQSLLELSPKVYMENNLQSDKYFGGLEKESHGYFDEIYAQEFGEVVENASGVEVDEGSKGHALQPQYNEFLTLNSSETQCQQLACPFCAKILLATQFEKHVRKHQPITRTLK